MIGLLDTPISKCGCGLEEDGKTLKLCVKHYCLLRDESELKYATDDDGVKLWCGVKVVLE